jgi:hypothetical protein
VDALRVSRLCNLATGCTGKRRVTAVEKRRRKSRNHKFDREDVSRARTKSLPLPKRQNTIPSKTDFTRCGATLNRQLTPSAQRSHKVLSNDTLRKFRGVESSPQMRKEYTDGVKYRQRPPTIPRRAASMESIQQVFDFYDDEDTSNEDDQYQHEASEGPTFEVIDIVEPSEAFPEDRDCCNGVGLGTQERQCLLIRTISPSLPLENEDHAHGYEFGTENESRPKLRSPELVRLATMRGRQRNSLFGQVQEDDGRKGSVSVGEQPSMLTRHRSESVLSCTRSVLSRSGSCTHLLGAVKVSGPPSDFLGLLNVPKEHNEELKLVSSFSKWECVRVHPCLRGCLIY